MPSHTSSSDFNVEHFIAWQLVVSSLWFVLRTGSDDQFL